MIVVDNGDAIRGDASAATVIDYTINGIVGTAATQLADGQLAAAEADLYLSAANGIVILSITLVNTDTSARTVNLYLKPSAGTSRRIIPKATSLLAGYSLHTDGVKVYVMSTSGQIVQTYSVHATSHQDAGADEISLTGLDGEPSTLTTHAALSTGIHGEVRKRKTADESCNNDNSLNNDTHLLFAVAASEVWAFQIRLLYISVSSTPGFKVGWSVPNGTTMKWSYLPVSGGTTENTETDSDGNLTTASWIKIGHFLGVIMVGATPGNINFQWCQKNATAENTTLKANSCLIAHKLA